MGDGAPLQDFQVSKQNKYNLNVIFAFQAGGISEKSLLGDFKAMITSFDVT